MHVHCCTVYSIVVNSTGEKCAYYSSIIPTKIRSLLCLKLCWHNPPGRIPVYQGRRKHFSFGLQSGEYPCRPIVANYLWACNGKVSVSLALFPGPCHFSCTKECTASNEKLGRAWGQGCSFTILWLILHL